MKEIITKSAFESFQEEPGLLAIRRLAAAGLSRIWQQMLNGSFGIISAHRGEMYLSQEGREENNRRDAELRDLLRHFNTGFVKMKGLWKDEKIGKFIPEDSLFIAGAREDDIRAIAELYGQDSYVYGNNGEFAIRSTSGGSDYMSGRVEDYIRQVEEEEVSPDVHSTIRGRDWLFDEERGKSLERARQQIEDTKDQLPGRNMTEVAAFILRGRRITKSAGTLSLKHDLSDGFYCLSKYVGSQVSLSGFSDGIVGSWCAAFIPLREK